MGLALRNIVSIAVFLLISVFGFQACSTAPERPRSLVPGDYEYVREYISWLAPREMKKYNATGLSIAVVDDRGLIWAKGFGYADKENNIAATPETVYRVASISKLLTATAVMQLAEQGKINIDAPLRNYIPGFSIKTRFPVRGAITPRNMMTHHSGLPSNFYKGIFSKQPEPFEKLTDEIKHEYAAYPPGLVYNYSNLGITLLGSVIERVSGRSFASYMGESLFEPMGMAGSSYSPKPGVILAKGYRDGKANGDPGIRDLPSSGMLSSVLDLGKFMTMVLADGEVRGNRILRPETLAEMLRPQNPNVPLDFDLKFGLGWALDGLGNTRLSNAGPVAHHGASMLSFQGQLLVLPESKLGVVVLSNSSSSRPAVDNVAVETLMTALEAKTGIRQPERAGVSESNHPLSPEEIDVYTGHYATPVGLVRVTGNSDGLEADVLGNRLSLVPRRDGMMGLKYRLLGLFPISLGELDYVGIARASAAGREILFARSQTLDMVFGEKVSPPTISEKWLKRIGAYEVANSGNDIMYFDNVRIDMNDGFLVMEYSSPTVAAGVFKFPISPVSEDEAVFLGLGTGMGETVQAINVNGEEGLLYSGYQLRKVSTQ